MMVLLGSQSEAPIPGTDLVKWIALALIFAAIQPLSAWLRRNPVYRMRAWTALGLMPFLITVAHLVMAARLVDDVTQYHTQGLEFSRWTH